MSLITIPIHQHHVRGYLEPKTLTLRTPYPTNAHPSTRIQLSETQHTQSTQKQRRSHAHLDLQPRRRISRITGRRTRLTSSITSNRGRSRARLGNQHCATSRVCGCSYHSSGTRERGKHRSTVKRRGGEGTASDEVIDVCFWSDIRCFMGKEGQVTTYHCRSCLNQMLTHRLRTRELRRWHHWLDIRTRGTLYRCHHRHYLLNYHSFERVVLHCRR